MKQRPPRPSTPLKIVVLSLFTIGLAVELLAIILLLASVARGEVTAGPSPASPLQALALRLMLLGALPIVVGYPLAITYRRNAERQAHTPAAGQTQQELDRSTGADVVRAVRVSYGARLRWPRRLLLLGLACALLGSPLALSGMQMERDYGVAFLAVPALTAVWTLASMRGTSRHIRNDLFEAGYKVRDAPPLFYSWHLRAWAARNAITPEMIGRAAWRSARR